MSYWDALTRNWALIEDGSSDPELRPIPLELPPREAAAWAAGVITRLPRWDVVASDPDAGTLHATRTTRLWRFVDDIHLRFVPDLDAGGCRLVGRSRSRVGKGDFGQNARNLKELRRALLGAAARDGRARESLAR